MTTPRRSTDDLTAPLALGELGRREFERSAPHRDAVRGSLVSLGLLTTSLLATALLGACSADVPSATDASSDHAHDAVFALTEQRAIAEELAGSPTHEAAAAFARLSFLHRAATQRALEISTSEDGVTWSEWTAGVRSDEASDPEYGVWVSDVDVADGTALYWRVRAADRAEGVAAVDTTELAVVTETLDEVAANLESSDDLAPTDAPTDAASSDVGGAREALTSFRRYRFDLGRVGRSWLWMLRGARRRGWGGSLYGPRTGLRTYAQQASLWNAYQSGRGAPAFPPWGPSRHLIRNVVKVGTWYQAVDTSDVPGLIRHGGAMGASLHVPYRGEPWHVEARRAFGPPRSWRP